MSTQKNLNRDFFKKWTPAMAYVLGYFAADGSMIINRRGGHFIEFTTTDRILLVRLLKVVGSNHKISRRPQGNEAWKKQYRLQFGSREWFSDLARLGFTPSKSKTLAFPIVPQAFLADFISEAHTPRLCLAGLR